jgi:regulatory protein
MRTGPVTRDELDEAGLKYLDRFDVTVSGMQRMFRRYLVRAHAKQRDVSAADPIVEELIRRYCEAGILSDERFASNMAAGLRRRGASRLGIVHKLRARGVNGDLAKDAVAEVDAGDADAELEAAKALVRRRRLGPYRAEPERSARAAKDLGVLARAGFSFEVARRALGTECEEPD